MERVLILTVFLQVIVACGSTSKSIVDRRMGTRGTASESGNGNAGKADGSTDQEKKDPEEGNYFALGNLKLDVPQEWTINQDAIDDTTRIVGIQTSDAYLTLYVKKDSGALDINSIFASSGATIVEAKASQTVSEIDFETIVTKKDQTFIAGFTTIVDGDGYYGYAKASQKDKASEVLTTLLNHLKE